MRLIFPADPRNPAQPDPAYAAEVEAATSPYSLIDFAALVDRHDVAAAIRRVAAPDTPTVAVYRGWMLQPEQYSALYMALVKLNLRLINAPFAYRNAHALPEWYHLLADHTPRSIWLPGTQFALPDIMQALEPFGAAPLILKDYVKSRKHEWATACYIPSATDPAAVERVVSRFLELQGADLYGGLVFREFVDFKPIGVHPQSGMPLTEEYRIFYLDGKPIAVYPYWEATIYPASEPPRDHFNPIAAMIRSRFFTLDVARRNNGDWLVVELGDAQVASLPESASAADFHARLRSLLA